MRIVDKYDAKEEKKSLNSVAKMYEKTYLDPACQRLGGVSRGSGWTKQDGVNYLESLLEGAVYNKILNADVHECLRFARDQNDQESIDYWEKLLKETPTIEYVSIDGNNSASYVTSYIRGTHDLKIRAPGHPTAKSLDEFTEDEQEDIKHTEKIDVVILRRILVSDMADLFRKLNTSTSLNPQERRQARFTPMADFIRTQANTASARTMFSNFIYNKEADLDKRSHEELVAQYSMKLHKNYKGALNKRPLDNFYDNNDDLGSKVRRDVANAMNDLILASQAAGVPLQRKLKKGTWQNLADLFHTVRSLNYKIKDHKEFFVWFLSRDASFNQDSQNVLQKDVEERSYTYWTTIYNNEKNYEKSRDLFKGAFLKSDLESRGVVSRIRTSADTFTFPQKRQAWLLQGGKSRTGESLSILELYLGDLEADHMTSFAHGGITEISNCEIMSRAENRAKGSNSNEPYFPHQL